MQASNPLNHKFAIALALVAMWLLANIGILFLIHTDDWWFLGLHGHDENTIKQIGLFFMAWTVAQIPAASSAGMIIGSSDFIHPLRTAFWTMISYQLLFSAIRVVHWPWMRAPNMDQSIPVLAHLISAFLLIGVSVLFTWLTPRFHRAFSR